MDEEVNLLIVGAGPFGLSMAAYAADLGIEHLVVGKSMEFWKGNMPEGMYLRSASDWHLDAAGVHTIDRFLEEQGLEPPDVVGAVREPPLLSRKLYLSYVQWFQQQRQIEPVPAYVQTLDYVENERARFRATLDDGRAIKARHVVVAVGFKYFQNVPDELAGLLPVERFAHTCDLVDFTGLRGKRCLILGGRQSAFEWAALLHEAGAVEVHVSYRHPSPAFTVSDWSWVNSLVDGLVDNPGWFRNLPPTEQEAINQRMWAEGRLKVETWLESRVLTEGVKLWPRTQITSCTELPGGELEARLDNGERLVVDQVILGTGYKALIDRVPFLAGGNILPRLATRNGYPVLDKQFQTSVPGLFITSMPANQDFGPFFAFTASVRTSAKIIGRDVVGKQAVGSRQ